MKGKQQTGHLLKSVYEPFTDGNHIGITPVFESHLKYFAEAVEEPWKERRSAKQQTKRHFSLYSTPDGGKQAEVPSRGRKPMTKLLFRLKLL